MQWPDFLFDLACRHNYKGFEKEIVVKFEWNNLLKDIKQYMFKFFLIDNENIKLVNKEFYYLFYFYQKQDKIFEMLKKYYVRDLEKCKFFNSMLFPNFTEKLNFNYKMINKILKEENFTPYLLYAKNCYCYERRWKGCDCSCGDTKDISDNEIVNFKNFIRNNSLPCNIKIIKLLFKKYENIDWIDELNFDPTIILELLCKTDTSFGIKIKLKLYNKYFPNNLEILSQWFNESSFFYKEMIDMAENQVDFLYHYIKQLNKKFDTYYGEKFKLLNQKIVNIEDKDCLKLYELYKCCDHEEIRKQMINFDSLARYLSSSLEKLDNKTKIYLMLKGFVKFDFDICKNNIGRSEWRFFCKRCNREQLLNLLLERDRFDIFTFHIIYYLIKKHEYTFIETVQNFNFYDFDYRILDLEYGEYNELMGKKISKHRGLDIYKLSEAKNIKLMYYIYKNYKNYNSYYELLIKLFPVLMQEKDTELLNKIFEICSEERVKELINNFLINEQI